MKTCRVELCEKPAKARGLCGTHHQRWLRHGDAAVTLHASPGVALATLASGLSQQSDDCLLWPHARGENGYGYVYVDGEVRSVHREVCRRVHGEPPTAQHEAAHSCGNGSSGCYNHRHLRWATTKQNSEDREIHGTTGRGVAKPSSRGSRNAQSKLTESQVLVIRRMGGKASPQTVADMFGVHRSTITRIHERKTWFWLQENGENQ